MEYNLTLTGIYYDCDVEDLYVGQKLVLKKEPDNKYDMEAICVFTQKNEKVGYVAKSWKTQAKGTYSAGRIYDKFEETANAEIAFVIQKSAIIKILD